MYRYIHITFLFSCTKYSKPNIHILLFSNGLMNIMLHYLPGNVFEAPVGKWSFKIKEMETRINNFTGE